MRGEGRDLLPADRANDSRRPYDSPHFSCVEGGLDPNRKETSAIERSAAERLRLAKRTEVSSVAQAPASIRGWGERMENYTIFDVLKALEEAKISFRLARDRPDTIRVDATLYGLRLEIECFDDNHI